MVAFDRVRTYGEVTPETGNITINTTGLKKGVTQLVIHNDSVEPTYGTGSVVIAGAYTVNEDNYIFMQAVTSSLILITISSEASATVPKTLQVAFSDQSSAITAGTNKVTFRMPYAITVTEVRVSLRTAQTSGSIFTVDLNESGTSILSTKITIDNGEKTSTTASTPAVISDPLVADDAEMTVDIDQVGDGTAVGGIITIIGY